MKTLTNCLLLALVLILGVSCKKDSIEKEELTFIKQEGPIELNLLQGELRHTDSLVRGGVLKIGEPNFITRHPGDDITYDLNYGVIEGKPTKDYVLDNKWCVTARYDNYTKAGCGWILVWHNSKSVMINNPPIEKFSSAEWQEGKLIDGEEILLYVEAY